MNEKQEAIRGFENMLDTAKVRVLSKVSLERPLTDNEFNEFKELMNKLYGVEG